jgi:protein-S-isoprenylcysteine O-methyltransferase Ste14
MARAVHPGRTIDWWWLISTAVLAALLFTFGWLHFSQWRTTGRPVGLGLAVQETVTAVLFVIRRRPRMASRDPIAWLATGIGAFGMLAARPAYDPLGGLEPLFIAMQLVGAAAAVVSLWALGRSFGLVAANRGVQTGGPYRVVRHPIYAGYMVTYLGYVCENPSPYNAALFAVVMLFQLVRIAKEEALLGADPAYAAYCRRVRYRLIPFVY